MIYVGIGIILFVVMLSITPKQEKTHTYNASFGDSKKYLSRFNHGFAVTGAKALTRNLSHTNVALFGPTGSGKSTSVIFSSAVSLARAKSSIIFFDVSGEVLSHTGHYLASKGYSVLRINFADPEYSEKFNSLAYCTSVSDIQKAATLLIANTNGDSKGEIFWQQASIMLLSLFARYLVFHADKKYCNWQNVLRLIEKFSYDKTQTIDKLFLRTKDEELVSNYKATLSMSSNTLQSVISSVRASMLLFTDQSVCQTTATNSIDLNQLREKPTAIFCCTPLKDLTYFKPLSALFFQTLFNFVLSRIPDDNERSIFFVLDEFASMRFGPAISSVVSNIRKFNSGMLLCMQDQNSLLQYGQSEAHQIKTNCATQVFLKGQPLDTCKELSQILGKYTYASEHGEKIRELMSPDELRMSEEAIILLNNQAPYKCRVVPYYENFWLMHKLKKRDYLPSQKQILTPPLIPFE